MKSLGAVVSAGLRSLSPRAMVQSFVQPVSLKDGEFWRDWLGTGSFVGTPVSQDRALQLATAWACVRRISGTIATLPCGFYERNKDGSRDAAVGHPLYELLHNQPNEDMTAVAFWEVIVASMLLWGNAYAEIRRGTQRRIVGLDFLHPARMVRKRENGSYRWHYVDPVQGTSRPIVDLLHVPAFTLDGVVGVSPIAYGANVFGAAIETDKTAAETFRDSLRSPGLVTMDMIFKKDQREEVRKHVRDVTSKGEYMVLEKGASFQKLGFDPESAELLATRSFNVEEICRFFLLDPAMVGHGQKDSNWGTGLEQKMLWFLIFTLREWCVRIEQAIRRSLLTPAERLKLYAEFNMDGLLRGDSQTRAMYLSTMGQNGYMTRNEGRRKENLPPMPGGDELTVQSNLVPLAKLGQTTPERTAASALLTWLGLNESPKE